MEVLRSLQSSCFRRLCHSQHKIQKAEASARRAMEEFMTAFNSRDPRAWAATLNYPKVRFAST
jgi:hypothetical protein